MSITRDFKLSLVAGRSVPLVINANQYDDGEIWRFTLLDENGQKYSPSTGSIIGLKSDGHIIANAGTVSSTGLVIIAETEQMTASPGKNFYELLIDDDTHGTANFVVFVEPRPGAGGTPSDSDLAMFQEAITAAGNVTQFQADIANLKQDVDDLEEADTNLASQIAQETSARTQQDAVLQAEIDQIIAPSGEAPSAAEVQNARIGVDGTTYDTLGNAIRGQVGDLKNALFVRTNQLIDLNNENFWYLNKNNSMATANGQIMSELIPINLDTNYYFAKASNISKYKVKFFGYDENGSYISAYDSGYLDNSSTINVSSVTYPTVKYLRFRCTLNQSDDYPNYPNPITYEEFRAYLTWINLTTGERNTTEYVPYSNSTIELLDDRVTALESEVYPSDTLAVDGASLTEADLNLARTKLNSLERRDFNFAWQTDTHVFSNGTDANILNLVSSANIGNTNFIINTGDLINGGYFPSAQMKLQIARAVGLYKKAKCDYFQLAGNHDDNSLYYINDTTRGKRNIIGYEDWFNMVIMRMADYNIGINTNKRYFSKLYEQTAYNQTYKFLAICLDSGDIDYSVDSGTQHVFGFKEEQLKWLIDTLTYTQYNEFVMVFVHCPIDGVSTTETVHNLTLITGILEAFANHTSFSGSSTETGWEATVSCDFTGKTGQHLIGVFQGHTHVDSLVTKNNINYVTLDNGHVASTDATGKVDAIDYVNINLALKRVDLIRLGGGDGADRYFTYY